MKKIVWIKKSTTICLGKLDVLTVPSIFTNMKADRLSDSVEKLTKNVENLFSEVTQVCLNCYQLS